MKTKHSYFQGYKLCPHYRYFKVWHFQLGAGPIPLAKGPLVGVFTVRCAKGFDRRKRYEHMNSIARKCFKFALPPFQDTKRKPRP